MLDPACRAGRTFAGVLDLEVDAPLACVELDLGNVPGRLQAKCSVEEDFDLVVHRVRGGQRQCRAVVPPQVMFVEKSISNGNGIEPLLVAYEQAKQVFSRNPLIHLLPHPFGCTH